MKEENQQAWLSMADEICRYTWKEEGCISYSFVKKTNDDAKDRFVIIEEWESMAHLEAHFEAEHFKRLVPPMDAISETVSIDLCRDALSTQRFPIKSTRKGRILVLYDSSTNCTAKMARQVCEGVKYVSHTEVRLRVVPGTVNFYDKQTESGDREILQGDEFATFDDLYWADGIACGTPTNLGGISWRMKKFWDEFSQSGGWPRIDGKLGVSFSSQGGHGGGAELVCMAMNQVMMNFGMSCFGITDYIGFKNTCHYGACNAKAPRDEIDIAVCRRLGTRLAEFVAYYIIRRDDLHPLVASKAFDIEKWGGVGIPIKDATIDEIVKSNEEGGKRASTLRNRIKTFQQMRATPRIVKRERNVLIFTSMLDYVHGSTAAAACFISTVCIELGMNPIVSEEASLLEKGGKGDMFDLIILVNNSGQIFDPSKEILTDHIKKGRGVLGIHAALASFLNGEDASGATLMEPTTGVIKNIFKAHFRNHPPVQSATVKVNRSNADALGLTADILPNSFIHEDEFFNFSANPDVNQVQVVASVDESTYVGGLMGSEHPVVWHYKDTFSNAPIFYCALGHFSHFFNSLDENNLHVANIIRAGIHYCSCG